MLRGILPAAPSDSTVIELAAAAIAWPGQVIQCLSIGSDLTSRGENLAGRTNVYVALLVEYEVLPTEVPHLAL